jgi:hypothetical protein
MAETRTIYRELEMVAIREDVSELGVKAGAMGTIATVYSDVWMLDVEVSREDGVTIGFVDLKVSEDGSLSVVAYTPLEADRQAYK